MPIKSRIGISAYPLDRHKCLSTALIYMPILERIGRSAYLGIKRKISYPCIKRLLTISLYTPLGEKYHLREINTEEFNYNIPLFRVTYSRRSCLQV